MERTILFGFITVVGLAFTVFATVKLTRVALTRWHPRLFAGLACLVSTLVVSSILALNDRLHGLVFVPILAASGAGFLLVLGGRGKNSHPRDRTADTARVSTRP